MSSQTRSLVMLGLLNVLAGGATFLYSSMAVAEGYSRAHVAAEAPPTGGDAGLRAARTAGNAAAFASGVLGVSGLACLALAWRSYTAPCRVER